MTYTRQIPSSFTQALLYKWCARWVQLYPACQRLSVVTYHFTSYGFSVDRNWTTCTHPTPAPKAWLACPQLVGTPRVSTPCFTSPFHPTNDPGKAQPSSSPGRPCLPRAHGNQCFASPMPSRCAPSCHRLRSRLLVSGFQSYCPSKTMIKLEPDS